jgi:hypothetical protein
VEAGRGVLDLETPPVALETNEHKLRLRHPLVDPQLDFPGGRYYIAGVNGLEWVNAYGNEVYAGSDGTDGGELPFALDNSLSSMLMGGNELAQNGQAPNKEPMPCPHGGPCYQGGGNGYTKTAQQVPITKPDVCHAAEILGLVGLVAVPGVEIPAATAWTIYGVGGASAIAGVTICW